MKNFNEMSFPEKLAHTRSYFQIHGIYFVPVKNAEVAANAKKHSGGKSKKKVAKPTKERDAQTVVGPQTDKSAVAYNLFINDPWENRPLDVLLTPHRDAYENTINELIASEKNPQAIQNILENESWELYNNIHEYETEHIYDIKRLIAERQFPMYLINDIDKYSEKNEGKRNESENNKSRKYEIIQPFYFDVTSFYPETIQWIESDMHIRQRYFKELKYRVDKVLNDIRRVNSRDISKEPHLGEISSLNIAELWYPIEKIYYVGKYESFEIKKARSDFFKVFGFSEKGYAKNIGNIKEREKGHRTPFLKELSEFLEDDFKYYESGSVRKIKASQKRDKEQNISS